MMRLRNLGMRVVGAWLLSSGFAAAAYGQIDLLESPTKSSLRGVSSAGAGVGWVSGSEGAVLRTEDGGHVWQRCATPPGGEHLDFRGVQGSDSQNAFVMSSGKGALSKIYKTTDGCASWTLVLENPDAPDGFWDAIGFDRSRRSGYVWGDVVGGSFALYTTVDGGATWARSKAAGLMVDAPGVGGFAASNSSFLGRTQQFGTSGPGGPFFYNAAGGSGSAVKLPMQGGSASAGVFSIAATGSILVAVGGDYTKPDDPAGTAAFSTDGGVHWAAAETSPHGYRSAVAYDAKHQAWLAVGPNGSDLSYDGGKTWRAVAGENAKDWNAISLPFVVGSHGRIGVVREEAFKR